MITKSHLGLSAKPHWLVPVLFLTGIQSIHAAPPKTPLELPKRATPQELSPYLYDEYGCAIPYPQKFRESCRTQKEKEAVKTKVLRSVAERKQLASPEFLNESKNLRGFSGLYYTPMPTANATVVLEETVTTSATASGYFSAVGLVRNETLEPITAITVTGQLMGKNGQALITTTTQALVTPLRPGEPAPFQLTAQIPFRNVTDVKWSVKWRVEKNKAIATYRDVEFSGGSHPIPWGKRERTECDTTNILPYPHIIEGSVQNFSGVDIPNPKIVVAWYEETGISSGKLVAVQATPLVKNIENAAPRKAEILPATSDYSTKVPGGLSVCIRVTNPSLAQRIEKGDVVRMTWVTGE